MLSAPRAQKRVAAGARFTVSGTLSPKHLAGAHSVELRLSRWNGSSWVLRRTVLTTNRDSGDVTRWAATFALAKTGRWKIVAAALADADHAATTSARGLRHGRPRQLTAAHAASQRETLSHVSDAPATRKKKAKRPEDDFASYAWRLIGTLRTAGRLAGPDGRPPPLLHARQGRVRRPARRGRRTSSGPGTTSAAA